MLGEIREMPGASNLFHRLLHDIRHDIDTPIIKRPAVNLFTAMRVTGVKEEKITWIDDIFLILTGQIPLPFFNKSNHIIIVKVVRELLHNSLEAVGFYMKVWVKLQCAGFVLHGMPPVGVVVLD